LEIIFGSTFNIYRSTPILCCTTGVGGGERTNSFDLEKIRKNLGKTSENVHKIPENLSKRLKI